EAPHPLVLLPGPLLLPAGVVPVLAPALVVGPRGLDVAERVRADPHVGPRRRDGEVADPGQGVLVVDPVPVGVHVVEAPAGALAGDAGAVAVDLSQAGRSHRRHPYPGAVAASPRPLDRGPPVARRGARAGDRASDQTPARADGPRAATVTDPSFIPVEDRHLLAVYPDRDHAQGARTALLDAGVAEEAIQLGVHDDTVSSLRAEQHDELTRAWVV